MKPIIYHTMFVPPFPTPHKTATKNCRLPIRYDSGEDAKKAFNKSLTGAVAALGRTWLKLVRLWRRTHNPTGYPDFTGNLQPPRSSDMRVYLLFGQFVDLTLSDPAAVPLRLNYCGPSQGCWYENSSEEQITSHETRGRRAHQTPTKLD
jgi:hypothetical protein